MHAYYLNLHNTIKCPPFPKKKNMHTSQISIIREKKYILTTTQKNHHDIKSPEASKSDLNQEINTRVEILNITGN